MTGVGGASGSGPAGAVLAELRERVRAVEDEHAADLLREQAARDLRDLDLVGAAVDLQHLRVAT
jgi:protein-L-isoaspartate O-methyltransferase